MMMSRRAAEIDRLCELASVGAGPAGAALGRLLGATVFSRAPLVRRAADATHLDADCIGIVFDAEGDLSGRVAIVLRESEHRDAVALMVGRRDPDAGVAESALRELGNILASQTVSAIADSLGATIMLSVPTLVTESAAERLPAMFAERGAHTRIESELADADGARRGLLVFVPDPTKDTRA
ncbi:MAG: chemotaxis protein CheC [Myxococcota bacterium]